MLTRCFKSGNSWAVRIPRELATGLPQEVQIERVGDTLTIRPTKTRSLSGALGVFAKFGAEFLPEGRPPSEEVGRDWDTGP